MNIFKQLLSMFAYLKWKYICSSMIRAEWILYHVEQRFSGIHIHKIQLVFYKIQHVSKFSVALDNYGFFR